MNQARPGSSGLKESKLHHELLLVRGIPSNGLGWSKHLKSMFNGEYRFLQPDLPILAAVPFNSNPCIHPKTERSNNLQCSDVEYDLSYHTSWMNTIMKKLDKINLQSCRHSWFSSKLVLQWRFKKAKDRSLSSKMKKIRSTCCWRESVEVGQSAWIASGVGSWDL